jgi:hypothetical protein
MAMSPRRSSRARTNPPPPGPPTHTNSSTSSNSLTRADRNTRSNNRQQSPRTSSLQRSESVDDTGSSNPTERLAARRSRRGNENEKDIKQKQDGENGEDGEIEEDVTRCICGHTEYPGPPPSASDSTGHNGTFTGLRDTAQATTLTYPLQICCQMTSAISSSNATIAMSGNTAAALG